MRLDRFRALAGAAAAAVLATGLIAACGGDDDEAQSLDITGSGSVKNATLEVPGSAEPGLTEITLDNQTKGPLEAQMIRVEGDRPLPQVIAAVGKIVDSQPVPDWFFAGGGVGAEPNQSATVAQVLEPGTYYALNTSAAGRPKPSDLKPIEVTGEASEDELPETDVTIDGFEYGFKAEGELKAGESEITFDNIGAQPHHILANRLKEGRTVADAEKFFNSNASGSGPFAGGQQDTVSTTVLEGGTGQNVTLDFKDPGTYVLYCFISDRQGGPPHAVKGMADEVEVK